MVLMRHHIKVNLQDIAIIFDLTPLPCIAVWTYFFIMIVRFSVRKSKSDVRHKYYSQEPWNAAVKIESFTIFSWFIFYYLWFKDSHVKGSCHGKGALAQHQSLPVEQSVQWDFTALDFRPLTLTT